MNQDQNFLPIVEEKEDTKRSSASTPLRFGCWGDTRTSFWEWAFVHEEIVIGAQKGPTGEEIFRECLNVREDAHWSSVISLTELAQKNSTSESFIDTVEQLDFT